MKIVQITDIHLHKIADTRLCDVEINTDETLYWVLDKVKQESPDLILATGDLSQDGSIESYQRLQIYFKKLPCNVYTIYGNHDDPANFDKYLLGGNIYKEPILETDIGTFIFLNSHEYGSNSGYLDQKNQDHLIASLKKYDNCIIVIHHHFIFLNTFIDKYILRNYQELLKIITIYKDKVKLCINGHVHNFYSNEFEGVKIYSSISTCLQFAKTPIMGIEKKSPGFTVYEFINDSYQVYEKII